MPLPRKIYKAQSIFGWAFFVVMIILLISGERKEAEVTKGKQDFIDLNDRLLASETLYEWNLIIL